MASVLGISFVAYNVILFVICGFAGHTGIFWMSWAFMLVAFAAMAGAGVVLGQKGMLLRDWLFGYPIIKHSTIYIIAEFLASTLFIILEDHIGWGLAFAVQFIFLCAYCICAFSCFLAKDTIENVHNHVSDKTRFIKLLRADAEMLVEKCDDADVKAECRKLAEAIRLSDPMSSEALFELEKDLALTVAECDKAVTAKDYCLAKELCAKAMLQLTERNKKCKALK